MDSLMMQEVKEELKVDSLMMQEVKEEVKCTV